MTNLKPIRINLTPEEALRRTMSVPATVSDPKPGKSAKPKKRAKPKAKK